MRKRTFLGFLVAIALLTLTVVWSCRKANTPVSSTGSHTSPAVEYVTATVSGRVLDVDQLPVSGATISTGSASTVTDINGQFILANIKLDKNAGYIMAKKPGYFNGSKTFELTANSTNYVEIQLITKNQAGQFSSASGGTVSVGNAGTITFPANAIVDSSTNSIYSGTVNVFAYFFDPASVDFKKTMPGELVGISKDSSEKSLQSYGMMVAELIGNNGQKLQIAVGKTAAISFALPSSLKSSAAATIPLWYFDEVKGLWREADSATLQGGNYIARVGHFSYWNCDHPFPLVHFQALIEDKNNNPLSGVKVGFLAEIDNTITFASDYTNAGGIAMGGIPAGKDLTLEIFDHCGNLAYSKNFTTTNSDIDLGTINANVQSIPIKFSGTLVDCSGKAVTNGIVRVFLDGVFTIASVNNGAFSVTINRCLPTPTTAQIVAVDQSTNLIDTLSVNNVTDANVNSLQLVACDQSNQYFYYTLKGVSDTLLLADYLFTNDFIMYEGRLISAAAYNNVGDYFHIYFQDTVLNSPQTNGVLISLTHYDSVYQVNTLTLTEFGSVDNGYIAGSFTGQVADNLNGYAILPISGKFRFKRTK